MKMPRAVSIIEGMLEGEAYGLMTQMLFNKRAHDIKGNRGQSIKIILSSKLNGKTITTNLLAKMQT